MKSNNRHKVFQLSLYVLAILGVAAVIYNGALLPALNGNGGAATTAFAQQTDPFLSQRLNQIEQRVSSIESRMIRLEQQARLSAGITQPTTSSGNDTELRLLRSEIEILRLRLAEAECGLARLDERTLTSAVRQARKKPNTGAIDRCRLNPDVPIQLSARP